MLVAADGAACPDGDRLDPSAGRYRWPSPPASDGGSPITSYTAQCLSTNGGVTKTKIGAGSPLLVTG